MTSGTDPRRALWLKHSVKEALLGRTLAHRIDTTHVLAGILSHIRSTDDAHVVASVIVEVVDGWADDSGYAECLTSTDVANILGLSLRTVQDYRLDGRLPTPRMVGRTPVWTREQIDEWQARRPGPGRWGPRR